MFWYGVIIGALTMLAFLLSMDDEDDDLVL